MNWLVFAIVTYLLLAVQTGLSAVLSFRGLTPNLLLILAVFVGLSARPSVVLWSSLILGLLLDLQPGPAMGGAAILGPHALGLLFGGWAVLQLRGLLFRESVITLVLLTLAVGVFASLVEVAIYALRGLGFLAGQPVEWRATSHLGRRMLEACYAAGLAIPLGLLLNQTRRWWRFAPVQRADRGL
jgi:rod shape-determining protein MreD